MALKSDFCELSLKLPRNENGSVVLTPLSIADLKDEVFPPATPSIDRLKRLGE
jgi:hypothetical protein